MARTAILVSHKAALLLTRNFLRLDKKHPEIPVHSERLSLAFQYILCVGFVRLEAFEILSPKLLDKVECLIEEYRQTRRNFFARCPHSKRKRRERGDLRTRFQSEIRVNCDLCTKWNARAKPPVKVEVLKSFSIVPKNCFQRVR